MTVTTIIAVAGTLSVMAAWFVLPATQSAGEATTEAELDQAA